MDLNKHISVQECGCRNIVLRQQRVMLSSEDKSASMIWIVISSQIWSNMHCYTNVKLIDKHSVYGKAQWNDSYPTAFEIVEGLSSMVHNVSSTTGTMCPYQIWKHKMITSHTTQNEDAQMFRDLAKSYLPGNHYIESKSFEKPIYYLVQSHTWNDVTSSKLV